MIEVICVATGDRAEADTPRAALLAALTLREDARRGMSYPRPLIRFYVDGRLVREEAGPISINPNGGSRAYPEKTITRV